MIGKISQSAKTYAKALIQIGESDILSYDEILKNLNEVLDVLKSSKDLSNILETPSVSIEQKNSIINDIFKDKLNLNIINFLKILVEKKRFSEYENIVSAYVYEFDKINKTQRVTVISAIDLSQQYKKKITEKLQNKLNKNIQADWQTNENIIGGLIIKIEDDIIDTSIKNKLENLSKNMIKGNL